MALAGAALAALAVSCGGGSPISPSLDLDRVRSAVLVGAGDIAVCGSNAAIATGALLDTIEGTVFTAGDNAYPHGSADDFRRCYHPAWGRHRGRTRPTPGNHEYETAGATAYFDYFGANAGPYGLGYYSFTVGDWLVVSLNSNVDARPGSTQTEWLRATLETSTASCTAAIWHHALYSSGPNGGSSQMQDVWRLLQRFGAEIVISGHEHQYERFTPMDADGRPDPRGLRLFVVGTGGAPLSSAVRLKPGSEVRAEVWGVLKLTLHSRSYDWQFVPVPESASFNDSGGGVCH